MTVEHPNPAKIIKDNVAKTRRGGKRKRHKTRKRKRKRRKHFKGGFGEKPGVGIKVGQTVRIKTENSTDDTKTWDPCWKVMVMMNRAAIVGKNMEEREVRFTDIKPQGMRSKFKLKCGGKRRKTRRRKNINADVSVKLIKNNFIYVNYSVIFSKSTGSCFQH